MICSFNVNSVDYIPLVSDISIISFQCSGFFNWPWKIATTPQFSYIQLMVLIQNSFCWLWLGYPGLLWQFLSLIVLPQTISNGQRGENTTNLGGNHFDECVTNKIQKLHGSYQRVKAQKSKDTGRDKLLHICQHWCHTDILNELINTRKIINNKNSQSKVLSIPNFGSKCKTSRKPELTDLQDAEWKIVR